MRFAPVPSVAVILVAILLLAISGGKSGTDVVSAAPDAPDQAHVLGDANCSGAVDASDALPVLKVLAGMAPTDGCFALGDVNCSLGDDVGDILGILEFAGNLSSGAIANCPSTGSVTMRLLTVDKFGSGTVLKSPSGTACSSQCSSTTVSLPESTEVALVPAADSDSHFDHWSACDSVSQSSCTLLLDRDKTVFATFAYDTPTITSTTKVIDDATMALLLHVDGDTYYFDPSATAIEALQPGDVIVSSVGQGLLRKIVSVMVASDQVTVVTEAAGLDDLIEQGTVLIDQDLAVSQPSAVSTAEAQPAAIANPIDVAFDGGVTLTGSYSIHPHLDLAIDFGLVCRCLHEARAILHLDQTAELALSATGGVSISHEQEIWNQPLAPITVPVGPVVLVFVPELSLNAGVSLTADAGFETSTSLSADISAGVEYTHDSGWRGIGDVTRDTSFSPPGLSGSVEAKAYLSPEFSLKLAGIVGPTVSLEGFSRLIAQPTDDPWWKLSAGIGADAGFEAEVPVFGRIAEFHTTVLEAEWVLAQAQGPAPSATPSPTPTQASLDELIQEEKAHMETEGWSLDCPDNSPNTREVFGSMDSITEYWIANYCKVPSAPLPNDLMVIYAFTNGSLVRKLELPGPQIGRIYLPQQLYNFDGTGVDDLPINYWLGCNDIACYRLRVYRVINGNVEQIPVVLPVPGLGGAVEATGYLDIDGDGIQEILVSDRQWFLHGFAHYQTPYSEYVLAWNGTEFHNASREGRFRSYFDKQVAFYKDRSSSETDTFKVSDAISIALYYGHSGRASQAWSSFYALTGMVTDPCWINALPLVETDLGLSVPKDGSEPTGSASGSLSGFPCPSSP